MPFFKSLPEDAGPATVFQAYPEIYGHWAEMGQALLNGRQYTIGVEAHPGQLFLAFAVIDKGIGQAEVEYGSIHYILL